MKMEQTECSETSAYKIQTPRNYPEESIKYLNVFTVTVSLYILTNSACSVFNAASCAAVVTVAKHTQN
jgi:hypothetical protein